MNSETITLIVIALKESDIRIFSQKENITRIISKVLATYRLEMNLLLIAYREGIVDEFLSSPQELLEITDLVKRLEGNSGITQEQANWAVSAWCKIINELISSRRKNVGRVIPLYEDEKNVTYEKGSFNEKFHEKGSWLDKNETKDSVFFMPPKMEYGYAATHYQLELGAGKCNSIERHYLDQIRQQEEGEGFEYYGDDEGWEHKRTPITAADLIINGNIDIYQYNLSELNNFYEFQDYEIPEEFEDGTIVDQ